MTTWWVSENDLEDEQLAVVNLPPEGDYLVVGPPGSGKTNLLLLRASHLTLAGHPDIRVIVFTRSLRDFLSIGSQNYQFDSANVLSYLKWATGFLFQHGIKVKEEGDFDQLRATVLAHLKELVAREDFEPEYFCLLLDEAQDYRPDEIDIFRRAAKYVFAVGDDRQRIYEASGALSHLGKSATKTITLQYHYRNGFAICTLADHIRPKFLLRPTANYNEAAAKSSALPFVCESFEAQLQRCTERIPDQIAAFPNDMIGILAPLKKDVQAIWDVVSQEFFEPCVLMSEGEDRSNISSSAKICVGTIHSAKGLEFRSLHILGLESLNKFRDKQKNLIYTGITRAKTSLSLYYSDKVVAYLEGALASLETHTKPSVGQLFKKKASS